MHDNSDSEDERMLDNARSSHDVRAYDQQLLLDEDERERDAMQSRQRRANPAGPLKQLFTRRYDEDAAEISESQLSASSPELLQGDGDRQRRRRRERRSRRKQRLKEDAMRGEDGALMYEMEEGAMDGNHPDADARNTSESGSEREASFEVDRKRLRDVQADKARKKGRIKKWCLVHVLILAGLVVLVYFAWQLSITRRTVKDRQTLLSNGTAVFGPTTIVISLDGFRADFLNREITPRLNAFIKEGVSPIYMLPSFPSVTFPNHYTLVTGLYPESHGIVGNTFWEPQMEDEFYYTNPLAMQPKWWGGEPIWVTAERQGIRTAIHMWPGSEAHIGGVEPTFLDQFNGKEALDRKVDRVMELLDKPGFEDQDANVNDLRPQFIACYVPNVDADGHQYGPNSTEIMTTISEVDIMLDQIFTGLEERNLTSIVNVIVVSDHGMATTDTTRLIQFEEILEADLIEHIDGWPLYGLRPRDPADLQRLYEEASSKAASHPGFDVYLRDVDMPERYHFSNNDRIAPLWLIPKTGWAIVRKSEFVVEEALASGKIYSPRGLHGYDYEHPLMRAIFVARGPAFPHEPNSRVATFQNIEVYNIICDSLGLDPVPNNGTLRLPLKSVGLHGPDSRPSNPNDPVDVTDPSDPEANANDSNEAATKASSGDAHADADQVVSISPIEASSAADPNERPPHLVGVDQPDSSAGDDDNVKPDSPNATDDGKSSNPRKKVWQWIKAELEKVKELLKGGAGGKDKQGGEGG